ncbi:MAG TPA: peroxide stress protein YaaA [Mycobacteriales bacterium]
MTRVVVLLPPSERKAAGGDRARRPGAFASLERDRARVRKALRRRDFDVGQLGVGPAATRSAMELNRAVDDAPCLPALWRYTGVLYEALDVAGAPAGLRAALDRDVVIVSGLWGAVRGDDPVPAYKLPIGARVPTLGRLAAWWRPRLTPVIGEHARGAVVWNLLPAAYAAAVGPLDGAAAVWTVRVVREAGGRRTVVGHDNKTVKGALARVLVDGQVRGPHGLDGWVGPGGYRVAGDAGGEVELVVRGDR